MKKHCLYNIIRCNLLLAVLLGLASCNVHEWPEEEETLPLTLHLHFTTAWGEQDHYWTRALTRTEKSDRVTSRVLGACDMRYLIRAYALGSDGNLVSQTPVESFTFTRTVLTDYDYDTEEVRLPAGTYRLMVWADFVETGSTADKYYHPASFSEIYLDENHEGNTDYRDAFRGWVDVTLVSDVYEVQTVSAEVEMQRPLARFTFVTTDLREFLEREATRVNRNNRTDTKEADTKDVDTKYPDTKDPEKDEPNSISLDDYRVVFYYTGFMPDTYNMFTDKPVDSATGVSFSSTLSQLNEDEATMGFDYVLVNGSESSVMVTVGLFDSENTPLSMSDEINVPLTRSVDTIVRGSFLMQEANGGVGIDPGFEGDHNINI